MAQTALKGKTFASLYHQGEVSLDQIDDFVDAWHEGGTALPLSEFLGRTCSGSSAIRPAFTLSWFIRFSRAPDLREPASGFRSTVMRRSAAHRFVAPKGPKQSSPGQRPGNLSSAHGRALLRAKQPIHSQTINSLTGDPMASAVAGIVPPLQGLCLLSFRLPKALPWAGLLRPLRGVGMQRALLPDEPLS